MGWSGGASGLRRLRSCCDTHYARRPLAMTSYPAPDFSSSRACFDALVSNLAGEQTAHLDHAALEDLIDSKGREVMRLLMQDHLELRAEREKATVAPMRGRDGIERTEVRHGCRQ